MAFEVRCDRCGEEGPAGRMALRGGVCYYCREETDGLRRAINELNEDQLQLEAEFSRKSRDAAMVWEDSFEGKKLRERIVDKMKAIRTLHHQGVPWPLKDFAQVERELTCRV